MIDTMRRVMRAIFPFRKVPFIAQSESSECGLACVAMVTAFHGRPKALRQLRTSFGASARGVSLSRVGEVAVALGFRVRPLRCEINELTQVRLPAIIHWKASHFVVLEAISGESFEVADPAKGHQTVSLSDFQSSFTGYLLELSPGVDFQKDKTRNRQELTIIDMARTVHGLAGAGSTLLALSFALLGISFLSPLLLQIVVDRVINTGDLGLLVVVGAALVTAALLHAMVEMARSFVVARFSMQMGPGWQVMAYRHLMELPLSYFWSRHAGDILSRLGSVNHIQRFIATAAVESVIDGLLAMIVIGLLIWYSPSLAAISIAALAVMLLLRLIAMQKIAEATEQTLSHAASQSTLTMESIRGVQSIRLAVKSGAFTSLFTASTGRLALSEFRLAMLRSLVSSASNLTLGVERVLVLIAGANFVIGNVLTIGMLLAYIAYKEILLSRATVMLERLLELRSANIHVDRLADILLQQREDLGDPTDSSSERTDKCVTVELRSVSFRYGPDQPWIIKDCSLVVPSGASIAIAGPSGCGKTTLVKILLGLLQPSEGEVLVNDVPVAEFGLSRFRSLCGTVMQDDVIFARSIFENVAFCEDEPNEDAVVRACMRANIHDEIVRMPLGYQTKVGDLGTSISGGQRQRIVLARAFYRNPRVLVLDEATSHLDMQNEREINAKLSELDVTRIVVAHRPETINAASMVYRVNNARVTRALTVPEAATV